MVRTAFALLTLLLTANAPHAEGPVPAEPAFERCATCHAVGDEAPKNAPTLNDIIGRPAASIEGFKYSDAMLEAGQKGVVWDLETLGKFIAKPRSVVNGSNMAFTGLRDPEDVAKVLAYLQAFSPAAE